MGFNSRFYFLDIGDKMKKYYRVYGPVQDGMFTCWQVVGPRGGFIAEFLTRKAATDFVRRKRGYTYKRVKVDLAEV